MRVLLAALAFLAFVAGGAFAPANAHPGHGATTHAVAIETTDDLSLFAETLPQEASALDHRCPVHGDETDGTCALLHASCCGLHGGVIAAGHPADGRLAPAGGYRGPGPERAFTGAIGSPLFEPPRA